MIEGAEVQGIEVGTMKNEEEEVQRVGIEIKLSLLQKAFSSQRKSHMNLVCLTQTRETGTTSFDTTNFQRRP